MKLKKFIIINPLRSSGYSWSTEDISINIKKGFLKRDIIDAFNVQNTWTPKSNEKCYFLPGCTVPRFKVREKHSCTIKPEYATSVFMNIKHLDESDNTWSIIDDLCRVPKQIMIDFIEFAYGPTHVHTVKLKALTKNYEDVYMPANTCSSLWTETPDITGKKGKGLKDFRPEGMEAIDSNRYYHYAYFEEAKLYVPYKENIIDKITCDFYSQDELINQVNKGNVVIDGQKYIELCAMADSSDEENLILVMEIMANCDIQKSFIYLLLLLHKFGSQFYYTKEINHVNFKGLLSFLGIAKREIQYTIPLETFTETMKTHNQFNRINVITLTQLYAGSDYYPSTHFENGPVLKQDVIKDMDDDFIVADYDEIEIPQEY